MTEAMELTLGYSVQYYKDPSAVTAILAG